MTVTSQWISSELSFEEESSVEHVKQIVDLKQVLLANQTLIKQQPELINSMTASFAPLTELPEHEEIVDNTASYAIDQLDDLQVDNACVNESRINEAIIEDDLESFMINEERFGEKIDDNLAKIINNNSH